MVPNTPWTPPWAHNHSPDPYHNVWGEGRESDHLKVFLPGPHLTHHPSLLPHLSTPISYGPLSLHLGPAEKGTKATGDLPWCFLGSAEGIKDLGALIQGYLAYVCIVGEVMADLPEVRTLNPPLGPLREWTWIRSVEGRYHLRIWPHRWVVVGSRKCWWGRYLRRGGAVRSRSHLPDWPLFSHQEPPPLVIVGTLGMTRPSGSTVSWVQRREMTVTGGCNRRLSLDAHGQEGQLGQVVPKETPWQLSREQK